jgi:SAM-dependent methyltransferase
MPPKLPFPPIELRRVVGPTDEASFDNPTGDLIWGDLAFDHLLPGEAYSKVFDFGCGCGRVARQMMLQRQPPERYAGIDIARKLITWCQENLTPANPSFHFHHHDVYNVTYAPENSPNRFLPFPAAKNSFTLVNAHSVFTHIYLDQTVNYLQECKRILDADKGIIRSTWFLFNRDWFPILADHQQCLYVNEADPTHAVYYDWKWLCSLFKQLELKVVHIEWTKVRGHQNEIYLAKGEKFRDRLADYRPPREVLGFWD